jgi:hypothetical protein
MSATTTQLLSSGQICKLRYDTIPVKVHLQTFLSIPITQKCQILTVVTLLSQMSDMYHLTMADFGRNISQENFPHLQ